MVVVWGVRAKEWSEFLRFWGRRQSTVSYLAGGEEEGYNYRTRNGRRIREGVPGR